MSQLEEYPLISVIVPIYRVEIYLEKCIKSILNQTYKNLEIILVDDGSDDACPDICDKYAVQDARIVLIHQQNVGVASARNSGLKVAKGEYIAYVDPDDWILEDMFMTLYKLMAASSADIVQCSAMDDMHPDRAEQRYIYEIEKENLWANVIDNKIKVVLWGKLYKRKVWENILFQEGIIFEDALIFPKLLTRCEKYTVTTDKLYWYTRRKNGIVRQKKTYLHMTSKECLICEYERYFKDNELMQKVGAFYLCEMIPGYRNAIFSAVDINKNTIRRHNRDMNALFMKYYNCARRTQYYKKMRKIKKLEWGLYVISPMLSYYMVACYKILDEQIRKKGIEQ